MYRECNFHFCSAFLVDCFHTPISRSSCNFLVRVKPCNHSIHNLTLSSSHNWGPCQCSINWSLFIYTSRFPCFIAQLSIHLHGEVFVRSLLHVFPCSMQFLGWLVGSGLLEILAHKCFLINFNGSSMAPWYRRALCQTSLIPFYRRTPPDAHLSCFCSELGQHLC